MGHGPVVFPGGRHPLRTGPGPRVFPHTPRIPRHHGPARPRPRPRPEPVRSV